MRGGRREYHWARRNSLEFMRMALFYLYGLEGKREVRRERGEARERREEREERGEGSGLRHTAHSMNQDFLIHANMKGIVKQRMCPVGVESLDR